MKKLNFVLLIMCSLWIEGVLGQIQSVQVSSPNKELSLKVFIEQQRLCYSLTANKVQIIETSPLGLTVDSIDLGSNPQILAEPTRTEINEEYPILGNHTKAQNRANESCIFLETAGKKFSLIVRVYNDGIGIRYTLPQGAKYIQEESTSFRLPATINKIAWSELSQCYEGLSFVTSLDKTPQDKPIMPPLTLQIGNYYLSISEADCETFSDMSVIRKDNTFKVDFPFGKKGWKVQKLADNSVLSLDGTYNGEMVSPWRTVIVAKNLTELVNSDLLKNLCPAPAKEYDFSWVKGGRCLWHWWSIDAPKYEDQKKWYDAAVRLKWEYYLIDEGWNTWKKDDKNQWDLLKEVIDYGKSVGVKSIVWVDSKEFRKAAPRRAYLEKVKAIGADGIKIDFIPDATSEIMQWYMGTMQDCAELKLLLNFHGSVKPTGLTRTYPNDITREAVRGNEYHMTRYQRVMSLDHDVCLPFTRLMAGAADVTPVMLNPKELQSQKFTWAHEFAQAIIYLSPITHFCDEYQFYLDSPMFDLFQTLPTVWDETRVLSCTEMGEVVAYARRKGETWWVGVMNGAKEREIKIPLDFLTKKTKATLVYDSNPNTAIDCKEKTLSPKDVLTIKLVAGGGFVARLN